MILLVTNKDDLAADYVIGALRDLGREYFRLNSEDLGASHFDIRIGCCSSYLTLCLDNRQVDLTDVTSIWLRRAIMPVPNVRIDPEAGRFAAGELKHLVEGLLLSLPVIWVNPLAATLLAERKLLQLHIARRLGFSIPPTVIATTTVSLRRALADWRGQAICKPIYHGFYSSESGDFAIYASRLMPERGLPSDEELALCPVLVQREIQRGEDYRVTVVGNEIFPVAIRWDHETTVDWRQSHAAVRYSASTLPSCVRDFCLRFMRSLDLRYAAFDFIRDSDSQWYFLEANPVGEWLWLERELGLPITSRLVSLLSNHQNDPFLRRPRRVV